MLETIVIVIVILAVFGGGLGYWGGWRGGPTAPGVAPGPGFTGNPLLIVLIVVVILLLAGGFGYSRHW